MYKVLSQLEVVDNSFEKLERYMSWKHQNIVERSSASSCGDSASAGEMSPRSSQGRIDTISMEINSPKNGAEGGKKTVDDF